jgi:hypothetical protein
MIAYGDPRELVKEGKSDPKVREFLTRGETSKEKLATSSQLPGMILQKAT